MERKEVRPDLFLIGLKQRDLPGTFIGAWVYRGEKSFLVDPGPTASVDQLLEGLRSLGIREMDFIFLTHIHIDHAGGTGSLLRHFPGTKVICHETGIPHLIDPRRLWEGTRKVQGDLALKYGEIDPVPERVLLSPDQFYREGFQIVKTPGHAPHHQVLIYNGYLFAGDAGGFYIPLKDRLFLRPATPPRFDLEEAVQSIEVLLGMAEIREICYAHFGILSDAKGMLRRFKNQLFLWRDVIEEQIRQSGWEGLVERVIPILLERDELFKPFRKLEEEEKKRELHFLENCIRGIGGQRA